MQRYQNHEYEQAVINISLSVVVAAIALSIVLSILFPPRKDVQADIPDPTEKAHESLDS